MELYKDIAKDKGRSKIKAVKEIKWFTTGEEIPDEAVVLSGWMDREIREIGGNDLPSYTTKRFFPFLIHAKKEE